MPLSRFVVERTVFARFPGLAVVGAVAFGVDNRAPREALDARWVAEWRDASRHAMHGNAQGHPRVKPWRDRFTAMGVSGKQFPSSIEALLRRALKGGDPLRWRTGPPKRARVAAPRAGRARGGSAPCRRCP